MTDLIDALDVYMVNLFRDKGVKAYGLAETIKKGAATQPVHVTTREQIAINDRWPMQWFHRILSGSFAPSEEDSFGSTIAKMETVRIRTVLATKHNLGEQLRYDFAKSIPGTLTVTGFRRIDISEQLTMIEDQEGVYNQEFGTGDYEKHATPWTIVAMEYDISFVGCPTAVC